MLNNELPQIKFKFEDTDVGENKLLKVLSQGEKRALYINNHQKPTYHPLSDFLNPALALLGQGLKKSPIGQKLDFANHSYANNNESFINQTF
jgi:hypothetical protein